VYGETVIYSGLGNGVTAVAVRADGKRWISSQVWHTDAVSMYMNSPVVAGGVLVGFSHRNRGQYFGLDPKTGKVLWTGEPRKGDNAAIVLAGGALLLLNNEAELLVGKAGREKLDVLRKYTVAQSPTWAHPLPLDRSIVIKDFEHLTAFALE
jgi:outer membrane protein assembly factor BamB